VLEAQDATLPEAGKVGRWTKADSLTHFADLVIRQTRTNEPDAKELSERRL
jgi:hypothetical protein